MKIAYFICYLNVAGAQTMLLQLLKKIDTKANKIKLFVRGKKFNTFIEDEIDKLGIQIVYLNLDEGNIFVKFYRILRMINILNRFNPDIIHTHLEYFYSYIYSILFNKKVITTIHSWPNRFLNKKNMFLIKIILKRGLLKVVCCAKCVENAFKEMVPINEKYITTIYNPIDINDYFHSKKINEKFSLVHVGRLSDIKNQELLIKSFKKTLQVNNNLHLNIVGDGELKEQLIKLTKDLNIESNVCFWGNRNDIPVILSKNDAFILTSKIECCPMVLIEAMASGLPCISTNVGGTSEIIDNAGILCEQDENSISNAILELLENKKKYNELSKNALNRSKLFDSNVICDLYLKLYREVV